MNELTKSKKYEIWSLATGLNHTPELASFPQLMIQYMRICPMIVMEHEGIYKLERRYSWIIAFDDKLFLCWEKPKEDSSERNLREWFRQIAEDMYRCLIMVGIKWHVNPDLWTDSHREEAAYFAKVLLTQWDGTLMLFGRQTEADELSQLLARPEKLLTLVRKIRRKKILLLGYYVGDGLERLGKIESLVKERDFKPLIFRDLDGCLQAVLEDSVLEEVITIAKLCEFVIAEDSERSGHLLELADLGATKIKTAILRRSGMGSSILIKSLVKKYGAFMKLFVYTDSNLSEVLDEVFKWHEATK